MTLDLPARTSLASPPATSWIVAAVVLVLNWTTPAPLQCPPGLGQHDSAPGAYSDTRAAKPGTLPRAKPRSSTHEAGAPKAPHNKASAGAKPHALLPAIPFVAATNAPSVAADIGASALLAIAARAFDARAPPAMTA